jgi:integrase
MSDTVIPEEEATADAGLSVSGPLPLVAEAIDTVNALQPFAQGLAAVVGAPAPVVQAWFDEAARAEVPEHDGTVDTARLAAQAYARRAKSDNTRLAYRAGVRAWCAWCDQHDLPCLPGRSEDVVAFLAAERGRGLSLGTVDLRRAAIRYLHFVAGCPVPTAEAHVAETMAGMRRHAADRGEAPEKKLAATAAILRDILATIPDDLPGLRDRALLLVGFAGALRRSELAAIRVEHLEVRERGLRLTLPRSKGERTGKAVTVPLPYGATELCPVRALRRWQSAAGITEGAVFRRIWQPPIRRGKGGRPLPSPVVGTQAIDAGTVARVVKRRATAAGFDRAAVAGHSLKRGALTTGMDQGVHPTRLKQLGRHRSYAVLDEYLQLGDPFEGHPLEGVL